MKNKFKVILGILSFWPLAYFLFFMFTVFFLIISVIFSHQPPQQDNFFIFFGALFVLHFLTMFDILGLLIYYTIHIFNNPAMKDEKRILWLIVLFLGNVFSVPVYWYYYILKEGE